MNNQTKRIAVLRIDQPSIFSIDTHGQDYQLIIDGLEGVPDGIQVDQAHKLVYWTNMGMNIGTSTEPNFDADDGSVEVIDLDGSHRRFVSGNGKFTTPKQLYLDTQKNRLYWCDREGGAVLRSNTDGSDLIRLVDRSNEVGGKSAILNQCVGIAVDHANQRILWTQKGPEKGGQGCIFCAGLEIPVGENALNRSDIQVLLKDLPEPIDLEVDEKNALLYWTDRGAAPNGNSLNRAKLTPNGLTDHEIICVGFDEAIGLAVDVEENVAFVADLGGQIWRVDLSTGHSAVIFQQGYLTGISLYNAS